ncbi:MAG: EF-hand domain-containing protein [Pseudomonadales bacterium]|nr:EF-hand domain-containing protein [Pseudomonadales bacterium]
MKIKLFLLGSCFALCSAGTMAQSSGLEVSDALLVPRGNFEAADANADGALAEKEFVAFIDANAEAKFGKANKIRKHKAYSRVFAKIDSDENAKVSWAEFAAAQSEFAAAQ